MTKNEQNQKTIGWKGHPWGRFTDCDLYLRLNSGFSHCCLLLFLASRLCSFPDRTRSPTLPQQGVGPNRGASPSKGLSPTMATFTPTSVMRKMHLEQRQDHPKGEHPSLCWCAPSSRLELLGHLAVPGSTAPGQTGHLGRAGFHIGWYRPICLV